MYRLKCQKSKSDIDMIMRMYWLNIYELCLVCHIHMSFYFFIIFLIYIDERGLAKFSIVKGVKNKYKNQHKK